MHAAELVLWPFLEEAPFASAMFDREMRYLHASQGWRRDYGLGDRVLRGVSHYDIFPEIPERWKQVLADLETLKAMPANPELKPYPTYGEDEQDQQ